jgi:hypothetical protein
VRRCANCSHPYYRHSGEMELCIISGCACPGFLSPSRSLRKVRSLEDAWRFAEALVPAGFYLSLEHRETPGTHEQYYWAGIRDGSTGTWQYADLHAPTPFAALMRLIAAMKGRMLP